MEPHPLSWNRTKTGNTTDDGDDDYGVDDSKRHPVRILVSFAKPLDRH